MDYSRYPAVSLRIYAPISRPSYRQDWTSTSFASYLRQQILAYADTAWYASHVLPCVSYIESITSMLLPRL